MSDLRDGPTMTNPHRLGVAHRSTRRLRLRLPEPLPLNPVPVSLDAGQVFADGVVAAIAHMRYSMGIFGQALEELFAYSRRAPGGERRLARGEGGSTVTPHDRTTVRP